MSTTLDELKEQYDNSDVEEIANEVETALRYAECSATRDAFVGNIQDAKNACRRLLTALEAIS